MKTWQVWLCVLLIVIVSGMIVCDVQMSRMVEKHRIEMVMKDKEIRKLKKDMVKFKMDVDMNRKRKRQMCEDVKIALIEN